MLFDTRRFFFVTVLAIISIGVCHLCCAQKLKPKERLSQIADAESLVREGAKPWHLRMSIQLFDLSGKPIEKGTVEEWWTAPGVYRRVVTSPSLNYSIPGGDNEPGKSRRTRYLINLLVDQLIDPVPDYGDFKDLSVTEEKRKFGKVELTCYGVLSASQLSHAPQLPSHPQFCVDEGMNDLRIRFDTGDFAAVRNRIGKFRGTELGLDNVLSYAGKDSITGHIDTLESYDPAKNSMEMTHPRESVQSIPGIILAGKIIKKQQPTYPDEAKYRHISGTVILSAIISKEGEISSLEVVASPDQSLSDSAVAAVKRWTYQPYLLNGQPTEVDTTITVNYNLSY